LSETLCTVGRPEDAMKVMAAQIERYGSRKPKDRAVSHYALARAAQAAGDRTRALAELDAGAKIDSTHAGILHALGRLATSEGQLDRAVRAYQALLLVRRPQEDTAAQQAYEKLVDLGRAPGEGREGDLTRAELLLELSRIVKRQGDNVRADEFMESAREAARENPASAERFERALARG
jgi:tetratricopeptide (TPR) repeat protein